MKTPFVINNYDKLVSIIDEYVDKLYDNYDIDVVTAAISCLRNDDDNNKHFRAAEHEWAFGLYLSNFLKKIENKEQFKKHAKVYFLEKFQDELNKFNTYAKFKNVIAPLDFLLKCAKRIKSATKHAENSKNVFGKYAWANKRKLSSLRPFEKDTPIELRAFNQIEAYIDGNTKAITSNTVSTLKSILKKGKYSDVIKEPTKKVIMRGMHLDYWQVKTLLGAEDFNKLPTTGDFKKKILKSFTFKPKFNVSSWTTDVDIARLFSRHWQNSWSIILYAQVSENSGKLLQCDNGLYNILNFAISQQEHEVIALGDVKISSIVVSH